MYKCIFTSKTATIFKRPRSMPGHVCKDSRVGIFSPDAAWVCMKISRGNTRVYLFSKECTREREKERGGDETSNLPSQNIDVVTPLLDTSSAYFPLCCFCVR